jgi:hypothetical protein
MIGMDLAYEPPTSATPEEVDDFFEQVMEHLVDLGVDDPGVGLDTRARRVTISATAEGADVGQALNEAVAAIRTAIHAVGGATPGWPTDLPYIQIAIVPVEVGDVPAASNLVDA